MNKYLLSIVVFHRGDCMFNGRVLLEELSEVPKRLTHFKPHMYVFITDIFALSDDFLFLKCELYDLRLNDTWLTAHTIDVSRDFYAEIRPYQDHPRFTNPDDEMVIYISVSRYISASEMIH